MNRLLRFARLSTNDVRKNSFHQLASKQALSIYGIGAVYSFIPKNACSTLRYSVAVHNGFLEPGDDPDWIHSNNETFCATQQQIVEAKYNFVVLRCPYRRLASAYLDKVVSADALARVLVSKSTSREDMDAVTAEDLHRLSFNDFVRLCLLPPSRVVDFHWYPQINFLMYEDYDDWFSVEAFDVATERLAQRGFVVHDTRDKITHSTKKYQKVEGNFSRVPAGEIFRMKHEGKVPSYEAMFDNETRQLAAQMFKQDVELFAAKIGADKLMFPD